MTKPNRTIDSAHLASIKHLKSYASEANASAGVEKSAPCLEGATLTVVMTPFRQQHGDGFRDRIVPILIYQGEEWARVQSCIYAAQSGFMAFA